VARHLTTAFGNQRQAQTARSAQGVDDQVFGGFGPGNVLGMIAKGLVFDLADGGDVAVCFQAYMHLQFLLLQSMK
jgi:hypothetical protein